jgi:hypothetical protein
MIFFCTIAATTPHWWSFYQSPDPARGADDRLADPQDRPVLAPERRRTPRVDEDGVLFSARRAWLAAQLHLIRSDRAPEEVVRRWFIRQLERAEQAVPYRGAEAEVHDLSVGMEVMESLESSQVGDARKVFAAMVLQVRNSCIRHKGERGGWVPATPDIMQITQSASGAHAYCYRRGPGGFKLATLKDVDGAEMMNPAGACSQHCRQLFTKRMCRSMSQPHRLTHNRPYTSETRI